MLVQLYYLAKEMPNIGLIFIYNEFCCHNLMSQLLEKVYQSHINLTLLNLWTGLHGSCGIPMKNYRIDGEFPCSHKITECAADSKSFLRGKKFTHCPHDTT